MSYYEAQSWQIPMRQTSWDQPPPPSRSGGLVLLWLPAQVTDDDGRDEFQVDRAIDNLNKGGKPFGASSRRDSLPMMGGARGFSDFDPRTGGTPQRHHSVSDYDQLRPHSGSHLQNFYTAQRHQPRPNEAEQMMQAKRRMAAQRERELRNYHQEQQYNRNVSSQNKSDRAISPNPMSEDDRRELIARQHRALYGNESGTFFDGAKTGDDSHTPRPGNQVAGNASSANAVRGASPRTFDPYAMGQVQSQAVAAEAANQIHSNEQGQQNTSTGPSPKPQQQQRSRANSNSSPASNNQNFSLFENAAQQSSRTSTSSPGGSPPRQGRTSAPGSGGVAPIGTRPAQGQAVNPALNKRSTTPLPSPLSYGFAPNESLSANSNANERSTSAASNPSSGAKDAGLAWSNSSGVWGNKNPLGVQASVWG
ncbi:MAG: hypothetical protein Q9190_007562 [Brigantiaea leucoxantha]